MSGGHVDTHIVVDGGGGYKAEALALNSCEWSGDWYVHTEYDASAEAPWTDTDAEVEVKGWGDFLPTEHEVNTNPDTGGLPPLDASVSAEAEWNLAREGQTYNVHARAWSRSGATVVAKATPDDDVTPGVDPCA